MVSTPSAGGRGISPTVWSTSSSRNSSTARPNLAPRLLIGLAILLLSRDYADHRHDGEDPDRDVPVLDRKGDQDQDKKDGPATAAGLLVLDHNPYWLLLRHRAPSSRSR